jgi:hypothetical protein
LDHGEEVDGELVVAGSDAAVVLQLGEEALDQVVVAVEALAEARLTTPVSLRRDVGRGTLALDQLPDAIRIIGLVCQHDGAWAKVVEQRGGNLPVTRLSS